MTELDQRFVAAGGGDREAFADWVGRVERPIRASLARFARAADVESVVQETLLRMWHYAREHAGELEGENASLRFALGMAKNIARSEARRNGRLAFLPPEDLPEAAVEPEPVADGRLMGFIRDCLRLMRGKPVEALFARLRFGTHQSDRDVAKGLGMSVNAFLQNIVRARQQLRDCLVRKGVAPGELEA